MSSVTTPRYHDVEIPVDAIADFCRRHRIRRLSLFGSILRDDFTPDSDIDLLVEFEPGSTPGLEFFRLQDELGELLGRRVDLQTPRSLSKYFRDTVWRRPRFCMSGRDDETSLRQMRDHALEAIKIAGGCSLQTLD